MRIILIISDSFRYDHLGALNLKKVDTPELDAFMKESVFFDNCFISSFPTVPHRFDMLTGRFGFHYRSWQPLDKTDIVLPEVLQDYGYVTQLLTDTANLIRRGYNFDRGYVGYYLIRGQERDLYYTKMNDPIEHIVPLEKARTTFYFGDHTMLDLGRWINNEWKREEDRFPAKVARIVENWIEDNYKTEDFFLHVDLFDPHEPFDPPDYLVEKYSPGYKGIPMMSVNYGPADVFTDDELGNMRGRYKGEVEMVSKYIGRMLRRLKDVGIYDDSMIIFTSDHGLYMGEHNCTGKVNICERDSRGHWPLYQEVTHVPLMIKMPGGKFAGKTISELVQPVDLMPTILEMAAIDPDAKLPGKSVLPDREIHLEHHGIAKGREQGLDPLHGFSLIPLMNGEACSRELTASCAQLGFGPPWMQFGFGGSDSDKTPPIQWSTLNSKEYAFYIGGDVGDKPQLFNRIEDPEQKNNIYEVGNPVAKEMAEKYCTFLASILGVDDDRVNWIRKRMKAPIARDLWT